MNNENKAVVSKTILKNSRRFNVYIKFFPTPNKIEIYANLWKIKMHNCKCALLEPDVTVDINESVAPPSG